MVVLILKIPIQIVKSILSNYDDIEWKEDILPTIASFEGNYPTKKMKLLCQDGH